MQAPTAADTDPPDAPVTSPADDRDGGAAQLLTVPRDQFFTVDNMIQAVSIETLTLTENDDNIIITVPSIVTSPPNLLTSLPASFPA